MWPVVYEKTYVIFEKDLTSYTLCGRHRIFIKACEARGSSHQAYLVSCQQAHTQISASSYLTKADLQGY